MASTLIKLIVFCLLGLGGWPSMARASTDGKQDNIQKQCAFTRYPSLCLQTLMQFGPHPADFMSSLVNKTIQETKLPSGYFTMLSDQMENQQETENAQSVTDYCQQLMEMSLKRLDQVSMALRDSPTRNKHDIQTWLSAALTFQQACKDSADGLSHSSDLMARISQKMVNLSGLASNALALVNRITNDHVKPEKNPKNRNLGEELVHDFPEWVSAKDRKLLQSSTIKADAVVAKDGTGNYATISEAINAASGGRFVIYVKKGVYKEKIHASKDGITLIGDGKDSTIIVGDDSVAGGSSMPGSATFTITGDGFIAKEIGFQNTAGPQGKQALALNVASDRSVFYHCSMVGYQDTLFAVALRQFYRECDIQGTIDFIFGNAAAVFQSCNLVLRGGARGSYDVILANGRTDPGQNTGFSVQKCTIQAGSDYSAAKRGSYLGRPWKQYSRAVVLQSSIDDSISSAGWVEWPGEPSYDKTLYFAEYSNTGPGAGTANRVKWPGYHIIGPEKASKFTVGKFISGKSWIQSAGVSFDSGL